MLRFSPFMILITVGGKSCRLSTNILLGKTVLNLVFFPMFVESCNHVYGEKTNSSRLELNREQFKSDRAYPAHRKNCDKKRKSSYFREKVVTNLTKNLTLAPPVVGPADCAIGFSQDFSFFECLC